MKISILLISVIFVSISTTIQAAAAKKIYRAENGAIIIEEEFDSAGTLISLKEWYDNGTPYIQRTFENGKPLEYLSWVHGKLTGKQTYKNGVLINEAGWNEKGDTYRHMVFDENGNRLYYKIWNETGIVIQERFYNSGYETENS